MSGEANVTYVGVTRAQHDLVLPQEMDALPGRAWRQLVAELPEVTRIGRTTPEPSSRTRQHSKESQCQKPSQKKRRKKRRRKQQDRESGVRWQTGQSVVTPQGPGTLVKLTGRKGLVRRADGVTQWLDLPMIKPPK